MARADRQAAQIVAHHDRVHAWKSEEPGLNEAFLAFLEHWVPHAAESCIHIRLPPEFSAVKRSIHIYAEHDPQRDAVLATLEVNDTYRRETRANTRASLREAALNGDVGRLEEDFLWLDPRFQGALKMLVWWGNDTLWGQCARAGRRASRLAYECLSGVTWESRFGGQESPIDHERRNRIQDEAAELRGSLQKRPYAIPLRVLRGRGDMTMTQAIASFLVEESGMSWRDAADATGTPQWRTLYSALRDRDLHKAGKARTPGKR